MNPGGIAALRGRFFREAILRSLEIPRESVSLVPVETLHELRGSKKLGR